MKARVIKRLKYLLSVQIRSEQRQKRREQRAESFQQTISARDRPYKIDGEESDVGRVMNELYESVLDEFKSSMTCYDVIVHALYKYYTEQTWIDNVQVSF